MTLSGTLHWSLATQKTTMMTILMNLTQLSECGPLDFPFKKLKDGQLKILARGHLRVAVRDITPHDIGSATTHHLQAICWKDRRHVGLLTTAFIGKSNVTVNRRVGLATAVVPAHLAIVWYNKYYGGVDRYVIARCCSYSTTLATESTG